MTAGLPRGEGGGGIGAEQFDRHIKSEKKKDILHIANNVLLRGGTQAGMISDLRSNHFKIFIRYLSKGKFTCLSVFLFLKSAKICTIFSNFVEKKGQNPCSIHLGTSPLKDSNVLCGSLSRKFYLRVTLFF